MKDAGRKSRAEREEPSTQKTVRFAAVVADAGKPELYLPLLDPKQDPAFMRAVKEQRVLSIRQDPTSQHSDFGTVGFEEGKYTTLLIFPKPLTAFAGARVVGIKYDMLGESRTASAVPRSVKLKARVEKASRPAAREPHPAKRVELKPPAPPKRIAPQPKEFRVRVRVTTITEKEVTVKAITKAEAKEKAQAMVEGEGEVRTVSVTKV